MAAAQEIGVSVVNAELHRGPQGAWDIHGIVYNVGDVPITLLGADGPDGEDGYIFATHDDITEELFEIALQPGNALDLMHGGLFLRFEDLDSPPVGEASTSFYFDGFVMPVDVRVMRP